ncbi:ankyrin repeat domain-containing protein [Wolbachia endosymbiont of Folsomia candida]|uniref:ankyrin repeat domain-containing protein n=1 Tax=Wolbachia endosymbiont of Folsomia candida TaxID=169402 RepID=UPI000A90BDC0|nr:ankyrin repeat domain-containing protein [Wolbachia endosymbiont of Folsomia candida]APR98870.1 hypothetical protein ASM33_06645 [Wolbachia endosymbiont of Folsomia candida]
MSTTEPNEQLINAVTEGDISKVEEFINAGANLYVADIKGWTYLHRAARHGHEKIVELLLAKEADEKIPQYFAFLNFASLNIVNINGSTALHVAAENGHEKVVELLLAKGADFNVANMNGSGALHVAARHGHEKVVELLLAKEADFNAVDNDEHTPLHLAAENGYTKVVELLLKNGAKHDEKDNNKCTPLYLAARYGHEKVVELLLAKGADLNVANINKSTALHYAAYNGHVKVVKLLLEKGADIFLRNYYVETPRDLATNKEIISLLEEAKEKRSKKGGEKINLHFMQDDDDADSDYEEEELGDLFLINGYSYAPRNLTTNKEVIRLFEETEQKQSKKGDKEISLHSMHDDADSGYEEEELVDGDKLPLVSSSSSHVEDHNQNEPSFLSKYKWEITIGVSIVVALTVGTSLVFATNYLPVLAIIGIAALSGFIVGSIAFGITHMISKPSTEIAEVAEKNLEQQASEGIKA